MRSSGSLAPLQIPTFRRFFAAKMVDLAGTMMAPVALAFAVLQVSDTATSLGVVLAARSIPLVVFLLLGGVLADRMPRLLVIQLSNVLAGLSQGVLAALVITGVAELWMLVVLSAVGGTVDAASMPAQEGLIPQLVPRRLLQQANVLQSLARGGLRIVAPTAAAWIVVSAGPGWALAVNAATWFVAAALLLRVRLPARVRSAEPPSVLADLREGWRVFTGHTWLWVVVATFFVLNAIHAGAWFTLGPAHAKDTIGEAAWGYLLSAESVGLLAISLVLLRRSLQRPLVLGMLGCSLLGLPIVAFGLTDNLVVLLLAAFVAGAGIEVFGIGWSLALQENIPEDKLSRAFSYDAVGSFAAIPVGQLLYGPLGERFGLARVLAVSGVVYLLVAFLPLLSRSVRHLQRAPLAEE